MKTNRLIYTLLALVPVVTSCSQDEPRHIDNTLTGRIEFRASLPEVTSRSTEVTGASLDHFTVNCLNSVADTVYFHYKTFSRNDVTGLYFSHDPECVWPNNHDLMQFVAFSPACEDMRLAGAFADTDFVLYPFKKGDAATLTDYKIDNLKIPTDITAQFDFVTAVGSGTLWDNEETPVDLKLEHRFSRIELNAWGASPNYSLEIAGVRLGGVAICGTFRFAPATDAPMWENVTKGCVERVFREGDHILNIDRLAGVDKTVSILSSNVEPGKTYDTSAMILPLTSEAWDYKGNAANGENHTDGVYLSVLMRVTDTTPYAPADPIVYPYTDNAEGMEVIYLAVKSTGEIAARLYRDGEGYFTDTTFSTVYTPAADEEIKAFGWAALPLSAEWEAGKIYTYTLNYTSGVGLHAPLDSDPGEPIISDKVLINVTVNDWESAGNKDVDVPRK